MSNEKDVPPDMSVDLRPFRLKREGHVHVEVVSTADRRPTLRRWYVQTEQKRPKVLAFMDGRDLTVLLAAGESLYLREGEDGSAHTILETRLPRTLPGRSWEVVTQPDKWGCIVLVHTTAWPTRPMFRLRITLRGWATRIFRRTR